MNFRLPIILAIALFFSSVAVIVIAADTQYTTMTWVVGRNKSFTLSYGGACSGTAFYFVEQFAASDGDPDADGNATRILPTSASDTNNVCQSETLAAMTLYNNGNVNLLIDGNFSADFNGSDINIAVRTWKGAATGCGTQGFGGWQFDCAFSATKGDTASQVTATQCRLFNFSNETTAVKLSTINIADTNYLCFAGDINTFVSGGNHAANFILTGR